MTIGSLTLTVMNGKTVLELKKEERVGVEIEGFGWELKG
jgi:hypothetical protein